MGLPLWLIKRKDLTDYPLANWNVIHAFVIAASSEKEARKYATKAGFSEVGQYKDYWTNKKITHAKKLSSGSCFKRPHIVLRRGNNN